MKKVAIVPYLKKPGVREIIDRSVSWLEKHGIGISIPHIEAEEIGLTRYAVGDDELFSGVDLAVVFGGDGTALRAVRLMRDEMPPVLGVNLGEMGFLMWTHPDDVERALEHVHSGKYRIEERLMLKVRISLADGRKIDRLALNDVLIGREEFSRLIKLNVLIDDRLFCTYAADGVLINTATGSTAYSFSAGGPVISPMADVFAMVPICPHSLNNKSLVFSAKEKLTIKPELKETIARTGVSIDGVTLSDLGKVEAVEVCLADKRFKFISINGLNFYESLGEKLKGWLGL